MLKFMGFATVAALSLSGFATLPASAAPSVPYCNSGSQQIGENADHIIGVLRSNGYDVTGVTSWNGCIRASITDTDGHQRMAFFDPDTLKLIDGDPSLQSSGNVGGAFLASPDLSSRNNG